MTFTPGHAVASAAARYTELVNDRRTRQAATLPADNAERIAAHAYTCPASPAPSGHLARHCFARNSSTCTWCNETPAWILADPDTTKDTP